MTNLDVGNAEAGSDGVTDAGDAADADLVLRTRSGDRTAFGELWRRHYRSGVTVARSVTASVDPDDLVQEAYTRIYQSIASGGGPTGSFRAYLYTSIRNTAATWGRSRRETPIETLDTIEDPATSEEATSAALDRSLTHRAFRSLPSRWQEVLWYSEIERMKPAEIAPLLGMKATAVAQLTFRAREGLREAWIQAHLRSVVDGSDCQWTIDRLGAYARENSSRRDLAKLERHLASCARCVIVASEAKDVSSRLALVLLPLTLGAVGAGSYLASLQLGAAPVAAAVAMPSTVIIGTVGAAPGAVAVTGAAGAGSAGVAAGAGSLGAAAATATAAATTAAAGAAGAGVFTGVGTMIGVAAAGLAVVVGAVTVGPVLAAPTDAAADAQTAISQPYEETATIADPMTSAQETTEDAVSAPPPQPDAGGQTDGAAVPATAGASGDEAAPADPPAAQAQPPAAPAAQPAKEPKTEPVKEPKTEPKGNQGSGSESGSESGSTPAGPHRAASQTGPTIASSSSTTSPDSGQVTIAVVVGGEPGGVVQARIRGVVHATATIDGTGTATLVLQPSDQELRVDSRVEFRYIDDAHRPTPSSARLAELL